MRRPGSPPGFKIRRRAGRSDSSSGRRSTFLLLAATLGPWWLVGCTPPDAGRPDQDARAFVRIASAEDTRPAGGPRLETLLTGTQASSPDVRRWAVRALGRLEDPRHHDAIVALLDDPHPRVRAQAANALAQAHHRGSGEAALPPLRTRAQVEMEPTAVAAVGRSLGRLNLPLNEARVVGRLLTRMSRDEAPGSAVRMPGLAQGMESVARRSAGRAVGPVLRARLEELARGDWPGTAPNPFGDAAVRTRTLAFLALATRAPGEGIPPGTGPSWATVTAGLEDPATPVRRAAAVFLRLQNAVRVERLLPTDGLVPGAPLPDPPDPAWARMERRALTDEEARVRVEAVRALGVRPRTTDDCALLLERADADDDVQVRLLALDALARPCPTGIDGDAGSRLAQENLLASVALTLDPEGGAEWHDAAHALHSLAGLDPETARNLLPRFMDHPDAFVRAWGARTAGRVGEVALLRGLLRDPSDNVLAAGLPGLVQAQGRAADDVLIQTIAEREGPGLLVVATDLLEGTDRPDAATAAALVGLSHLSREPSQTLRDARVALLDLIEAAPDTSRADELAPYLRDPDPAVAERASEILTAWTGQRWIAAPRPYPGLPLPTPAELRAMEGGQLVFEMARGGSFVVQLLPFEAPTNAYRLWTFAGEGVLDGLTLHRIVPNFVVQGGSPGANEYAGHTSYTRDEVGLVSQWRGTVGLSTRGRDTGDGQIYVNLVDNVRLNHDYTILGRVVEGMGVVESVREGDVIRGVHRREDPGSE